MMPPLTILPRLIGVALFPTVMWASAFFAYSPVERDDDPAGVTHYRYGFIEDSDDTQELLCACMPASFQEKIYARTPDQASVFLMNGTIPGGRYPSPLFYMWSTKEEIRGQPPRYTQHRIYYIPPTETTPDFEGGTSCIAETRIRDAHYKLRKNTTYRLRQNYMGRLCRQSIGGELTIYDATHTTFIGIHHHLDEDGKLILRCTPQEMTVDEFQLFLPLIRAVERYFSRLHEGYRYQTLEIHAPHIPFLRHLFANWTSNALRDEKIFFDGSGYYCQLPLGAA